MSDEVVAEGLKMTGHICPTCGSYYPGVPKISDMRLIPGAPIVKRAITVAMVGGHTLGLIWRDTPVYAAMFADYALQKGVPVYLTMVCPCGNRHSATKQCECTADMMWKWWESGPYGAALASDICILVPEPLPADVMRFAKNPVVESFTVDVYAREAREAREFLANVSREMGKVAESFLRTTILSMGVDGMRAQQAINVARSCQALAGEYGEIRPQHVAEAIQYHPWGNDL
jgi:predicted ATPase with chaperone activity